MAMPKQPTLYIPRPFASEGTYQTIPDEATESGRASYKEGFPTVTQKPLADGGVPPNRNDFNGLFYLLTAFGMWQQSGGQWTYSESLNYTTPCIAYWNGVLWWCVKDNGPDTGNGLMTPGNGSESLEYWQDLLTALMEMQELAAAMTGSNPSQLGSDKTPVGTVISYYGTTAPDGYLVCDGSSFSASAYPELYALLGKATTPDLRGYFIRGYDSANRIDPSGSSRSIGGTQTDAGRNVTAHATAMPGTSANHTGEGAIYWTTYRGERAIGNVANTPHGMYFDASRCWGSSHTADEFRPANVCLLYCIKHDIV